MNTYELFNIIFQVTKFVVEVILKIIEFKMKKENNRHRKTRKRLSPKK